MNIICNQEEDEDEEELDIEEALEVFLDYRERARDFNLDRSIRDACFR